MAVARKWMRWGYVLAVHAILGVLLLLPGFSSRVQNRLGVPHPSPDPYVAKLLDFHRLMDDSVPTGSTIFLGDSITQGLATAAVAPNAINYGIGGETTEQLIAALPQYRSLSRAGEIVLTIGINDFIEGRGDGLIARYQRLAQALPPTVPLVWSAVMPIVNETPTATNAAIHAANQAIEALCAARGYCRFVDTQRLFTDAGGRVRADRFLADGIHLNGAGYRDWIALLQGAVHQATADRIPRPAGAAPARLSLPADPA